MLEERSGSFSAVPKALALLAALSGRGRQPANDTRLGLGWKSWNFLARSLALRAEEKVRDADDAVAEARWQLDRRFVGIALPAGPCQAIIGPTCAISQMEKRAGHTNRAQYSAQPPLSPASPPCEAFAQLLTEPLATVVDTACCGRLGVAALGGKRIRKKHCPKTV